MPNDTESVAIDVNTDNLDDFEKLLSGKAQVLEDTPEPEAVEPETPAVEDEPEAGDEPEAEAESDPDEPSDDESAPEDEPAPEEDVLPKSKNRKPAKERIAELTSDVYLERRAREQAERRIEELERRFQAEKTETVAPVTNAAPHPDARDDKGELVYPLGEFDPQFIKAFTDYTFEQKMAEFNANQEKAAARQVEAAREAAWNNKLTEAQKEFDDFLPTIGRLDGELRNIDPNMGIFLSQTVMEMDLGPQVLYYLANHPGEASKIASLSPTQAALSLGRVEAKIEAALKKPAKPAPQARQTAAPEPAPVAPRGNSGRTSVSPDTDNLDDFEKLFFAKS